MEPFGIENVKFTHLRDLSNISGWGFFGEGNTLWIYGRLKDYRSIIQGRLFKSEQTGNREFSVFIPIDDYLNYMVGIGAVRIGSGQSQAADAGSRIIKDCSNCPFTEVVNEQGMSFTRCKHENGNRESYMDRLWGCREQFTKTPEWCPLGLG